MKWLQIIEIRLDAEYESDAELFTATNCSAFWQAQAKPFYYTIMAINV